MTSDLPELSSTEENLVEKPKKPKKERRFRGWFTLFLAWMALFFTAIGIFAGYKNWLRIHSKAKENKASIELIQKQLDDMPSNEKLSAIRTEILEKTKKLEEQTSQTLTKTQRYAQQAQHYAETIDAQVAEITQMQARLQLNSKPSTSKDWILSETEFLLRMANRQLHLDNDKKSALAALKAADENLARLGSPHFLPVRQQISKDIVRLEQYNEVDIADLSQQITSMIIGLSPLPANDAAEITEGKPIKLGSDDKAEASNENKENSLWSDVKKQAADAFNQAVIIRKHNQPIQNELDAESRLQLYRLIQLRLETLRMMALQGLDTEYHQQIKLINKAVSEYYPKKRAESLLKTLQQLDAYNLAPKKPDISASIKQLESALLAEKAQQSTNTEDKK